MIRTPRIHDRFKGERTTDDIETILRLLADTKPPPVIFADDVADLIERSTEHVKMDDDGHVCRIMIIPKDQELKVIWLLPRGPSRDILAPVLSAALTETLAAHPEAKAWRLSATFNDQADGGRELCLAWQEKFPGTTVGQRLDDGLWEVYWTLEATEDMGRQVTSL